MYVSKSIATLITIATSARTIENSEKLQLGGQEDPHQELSSKGEESGTLSRRVSRVESLRRLLLGASQMDSRRFFDRKKHRYTVDKSIGIQTHNYFNVFRIIFSYKSKCV